MKMLIGTVSVLLSAHNRKKICFLVLWLSLNSLSFGAGETITLESGERINLLKVLGSGNTGTVWSASQGSKQFAVKIYKSVPPDKTVINTWSELSASDPTFFHYGKKVKKGMLSSSRGTESIHFIKSDLAVGDVETLLASISYNDRIQLAYQVYGKGVHALKTLGKKAKVYGDFSLANFLYSLDKKGRRKIQLSDLDTVRDVGSPWKPSHLRYLPPEVGIKAGDLKSHPVSDAFSLGASIFEILYREGPYESAAYVSNASFAEGLIHDDYFDYSPTEVDRLVVRNVIALPNNERVFEEGILRYTRSIPKNISREDLKKYLNLTKFLEASLQWRPVYRKSQLKSLAELKDWSAKLPSLEGVKFPSRAVGPEHTKVGNIEQTVDRKVTEAETTNAYYYISDGMSRVMTGLGNALIEARRRQEETLTFRCWRAFQKMMRKQ